MNSETLARLCYFHNISSDTVLYHIRFDDIRLDKDNKREIAACLDKSKNYSIFNKARSIISLSINI